MAIWSGVKRQLRSVVEWKSPAQSDLFYRWSENGDEIKDASVLIVGPGQGCIFVYEGKVVANIKSEGRHSLLTDNIPFWTTITKFLQAFESEHKVGLYFYNRTQILDQKWGTRSIVKYLDPIYNFPVGLRAFGNFSMQIVDAEHFFTQVIGASDLYTTFEFRSLITDRIVHPLTDYLAEQKLSYTQIDAKRNEISLDLLQILESEFEDLGFSLIDFRIEGSEFDEQTMARINKIADVGADIHAAKSADISYKELQQLDALSDAAKNEAGAAGVFMGAGAGTMLSQSMGETFEQRVGTRSIKARLVELKELYEASLIDESEYSAKKQNLLKEL